MISKFIAKGFRCLRDVEVELTPLHALIGPNDSGKSTILAGLELVCSQLAEGRLTREIPRFQELSVRRGGTKWGIFAGNGTPNWGRVVEGGDGRTIGEAAATRARLLRLDPDEVRRPCPLIQKGQPVAIKGDRGFGLAAVYYDVISRGDDAFAAIKRRLGEQFPTIKRLGVPAVSGHEVAFEVELHDGTEVAPEQMSEGFLYWLAFAVLPYVDPVDVLLIEEPENGLHPARIREVVRVLRQLSESGTQVVMATHSPLVVNELNPEEVTVVTRPSVEEGTRVTRIRNTPDFARRNEAFALGELWVAFADGQQEQLLLHPRATTARRSEIASSP